MFYIIKFDEEYSKLDNLQYFVSHGFILDAEQTKLDQEVIDRLRNQMKEQG